MPLLTNSPLILLYRPGHVDFTIEVERALRVLDGAILVLCGVSGVQSQTLTVDRQMKRYEIPRLAFINKLDRSGANPWKVISGIRSELRLPASAVQIPMGLEADFEGVIDLIGRKAYTFLGTKGNQVQEDEVPEGYKELMESKRSELIESLAEIDEEIGDMFLNEIEPTVEQLHSAIRKQTIARKFVPVFMGSAYKNKGVQKLLDGVTRYLPAPYEVPIVALDAGNNEAPVSLACDPTKPLVALAFKLEESRYGQLTYIRVYQGTMKKGMMVYNVKTGRKVKVPRLVRMHSNEMEDVEQVSAGDVVAVFGVECSSMDTFTDGSHQFVMSSMFVPNPVMSLAVKPKESQMMTNFSKAMGKFTREDPTLRIMTDDKTKEVILSGMGELHLEIYIERLRREYQVDCITGSPAVNYKEKISQRANFSYLHKKQSGGSGQYARVIGYIEPIEEELVKKGIEFQFENEVVGTNIPPEFIPSCEKGARNACAKGVLAGYPLVGIRVVVTDGQAHSVDSNDLAFQLAMLYAMRQCSKDAKPVILEPVMSLEVNVPSDFQGNVIGGLNKRNGMIMSSDLSDDGKQATIKAEVPLAGMFGYSTDIRSSTQGKGEFSMEYKEHQPVPKHAQEEMIKKFLEKQAEENAEK
jgi:elongation factor G